MSYFINFPTLMYDPVGNGDNAKLVTNILKRVRMKANKKKNVVMIENTLKFHILLSKFI